MKKKNDEDKPSTFLQGIILCTQLMAISMIITCVGMWSVIYLTDVPVAPKIPEAKVIELKDLAKVQAQMVVKVTEFESQTFGTGFPLRFGQKVVIITNAHVCQKDEHDLNTIGKTMGVGEDQVEQVIAMDREIDLCILSSTNPFIGFTLATHPVDELDVVYTIGYGAGIKNIKTGRYLGVHGNAEIFSGQTVGGQSGSPLLNEEGNVVGVIWGKRLDDTQYGLFVPLHEIRDFVGHVLYDTPRETK